MNITKINNIIFHLYPILATLLVIFALLLVFWPLLAHGQTVINNNSSTVTNNVSTKSSSSGGQSSASTKIYTEVNGEVVSDEEYSSTGEDEAIIKVEQTVVSDNEGTTVETKVNDEAVLDEMVENEELKDNPDELSTTDKDEVMIQETETLPNYVEPATVVEPKETSKEEMNTGDDCGDSIETAVCSPPPFVEDDLIEETTAEESPIKISWWQKIISNIENWWNNLFSYFV